jgi:hypothetical protein
MLLAGFERHSQKAERRNDLSEQKTLEIYLCS